MLIEELGKLTEQNEPQTLDELFTQSKDGMMLERVRSAIFSMLPELKNSIISEIKQIIPAEIALAVSKIRIRHGQDGKTPVKGVDYRDGIDGKNAKIDEDKLISEIYTKVMEKIPPLALNRQRGGHGGSGTSGGGFTLLPATGTIDGVNADFTFTEQPTYIVQDGAWYTVNKGWTWSGFTATMTIPPNDNIYGFK